MKILICSDSHTRLDYFQKVIDLEEPEMIIFGGDHSTDAIDMSLVYNEIPFKIVRGNTDYFDGMRLMGKDVSEYERIFSFDNLRIFATHGFIKSMTSYEKEARENKCDILVYGHTHVKKLEKKDNLIILNPGSPSRPRDYAPSFAILEDKVITLYNAVDFEIIEKLNI